MTKLYKPLLAALGLTYPQYLVMMALWAQDGQRVSDLGDVLFLDSGTLTPLVKRLAQAGWLARTRDALDERCVRVTLTPAGRNLRLRAGKVQQCVGQSIGLQLSEVTRLTVQIQRVRDQLLA